MSNNDCPEGDNVPESLDSSVSTHPTGSPQQRLNEAEKQIGIVMDEVMTDPDREVLKHQLLDADPDSVGGDA